MRRAWPLHVSVRSRLFEALSSALGLAILLPCESAFAACDNTAPLSGQTVTCSNTAPNPSTTPVIAVTGSTNVAANVQAGAELDVGGNNGILVYDRSAVTNLGTIRVTGDSFYGIAAQGTGAGQNGLTNRGLIVTTGAGSDGMFNSAAAVTMLNYTRGVFQRSGTIAAAMNDVASAGGGTLTNNGQLSTTGDSSAGISAQTATDTVVTTARSQQRVPARRHLYVQHLHHEHRHDQHLGLRLARHHFRGCVTERHYQHRKDHHQRSRRLHYGQRHVQQRSRRKHRHQGEQRHRCE